MVEWEARCLALEQAYVHEVYHQMGGSEPGAKQHPPWPRVTHFLNQLEPGSIVCDVGCGSGKYLNVNPSIFKLGVDRCSRLAMTAREDQNEVMICDNLALPFRDESFDAVLSIAVVHHFATTERRITALKELARILRIGGRLVISVWAMEQRHRKFESQDVLVPWHRPQTYSSPSVELTPTTTTSEEETHQHLYTACTHTSESDSAPSTRPAAVKRKTKHKEVVPSPSSSSLSSPNESCYSFVRRAFKKLTGVKRSPTTRPWFLDSWTSCATKDPPPRRYDPEGCEDIQDLPIELRHLEGDEALSFEKPHVKSVLQTSTDVTLNHKSKSLSDIITNEHKSIVRSQSSFPTLEGIKNNLKNDENEIKPKLVKQKQSMCDEDVESEERDEATDMKDLIKSLPEFKISGYGMNKKGNVFKQSSMNEELMSAERLREKEKVRQNIQKQASLNEELIFNRNKTLDSIRDTFFSASTAKRLQLLKNGLTNKFKSSTTGIEKVSGASIKNGFVRILQGWASGDLNASSPQPAPPPPPPPPPPIPVEFKTFIIDSKKDQPGERRHSREDGSDSSKDSSLQSDTSVDSEDSFASVIFIPKADQLDQPSSTTSPTLQSTPGSPQPTSPKIKYPPPISPKMKNSTQMSFGLPSHPSSPKLKHPNQLINSPTPSSPKMKYFPQPTPPRTFQPGLLTSPTSRGPLKFTPSSATNSPQVCKTIVASSKSLPPTYKIPHLTPTSPTGDHTTLPDKESSPPPPISTGAIPKTKSSFNISETSLLSHDFKSYEDLKPSLSPGTSPTSPEKPVVATVDIVPLIKEEIVIEEKDEEPLDENLKIVQEIVRQKSTSRHHQFPLVRRSSTMFGRTDSPPSRPVPRLLSLEIFNPETDDMDSDSSGLSSPDSVGSVISIKNEEETATVSESVAEQKQETASSTVNSNRTSGVGAEIYPITETNQETLDLKLHLEEGAVGGINPSPRLSPLLEAAADVANTLEETVETVIQSSPQPKRKHLSLRNDSRLLLQDLTSSSTNKSIFSEKKNKPIEQTFLSPLRKTIEVPKKLLLDHDKISKERASFEQSMKMEEQQGKRWDEECRQHLAEFAEKLSEKLLAEIDRYREQSAVMHSLSPMDSTYGTDYSDIQDPYLFKLNEDLHDLTKLSIELHEENIAMKAKEMKFKENESKAERVKGEGASMEERHVEQHLKLDTCISNLSYPNQSSSLFPITPDKRTIAYLPEEQIPLLEEYSDDGSNSLSSSPNMKPSIECTFLSQHNSPDGEVAVETKCDSEKNQKEETTLISTTKLGLKEKNETNEKYGGSEETWVDSRRNTILPSGKSLLTSLLTPTIQTIPDIPSTIKKEETTKIELLPAKEMPRRPSISVEMTDSIEKTHKEEILAECALHLGVSLESSEAGDISERTGSSSEGSRPSSRRDTIQISHSPSIFSLKPGLSIESSDAGDISERTGSDGSRESRKDTASLSDITSGSQNSLLRPGNSVESSDAGDVSDRTGSDISRQNTSSAGKTPSTASITSDKASDCSKDARFADRRMARCDGRSSSEEMPLPRSSMNKLVRQRASTQEPTEILAKAQSCETSLSGSTSQDSLLSDSGGGAITFHRYYHVFREGELDQLIEKYVENLHIISSYYDHANWCVIAEKVQVWTI